MLRPAPRSRKLSVASGLEPGLIPCEPLTRRLRTYYAPCRSAAGGASDSWSVGGQLIPQAVPSRQTGKCIPDTESGLEDHVALPASM